MTNGQMVELITRTMTARRECVDAAKAEKGEDMRQRLLLRVIAQCGSPSMDYRKREVSAEVLLKNTFDRIDAAIDFWDKVRTLPESEQEDIRKEYHPMESQSAKDILPNTD